MTDKQIIDGVDVSGCCFYEKHYTEDEDVEIKHFCKIFHYHCETETNCYYKQLIRKEQECKKLKEYFETAKEASNCNLKALGEMTEWADKLDEENDQLKAENEELKEQLTILDDEDVVVEITVKQFEEYKKLKQTLTEIKEIAEDQKDLLENMRIDVLEQILEKISEVV